VGVKRLCRGFRWLFFRLLVVLIPLACFALLAAAYAYVHFSQMITVGFEEKRWSLSSKVSAEPESLYPGLPLRLEDVRASLERLGYRPAQSITAQGQYAMMGRRSTLARAIFTTPIV
jgi:hypothetical protein